MLKLTEQLDLGGLNVKIDLERRWKMRRLIGIILIVQAVLTYLILNELNRLSVFLIDLILFWGEDDGLVLSWSGELSWVTHVGLAIVIILGIYFILTKKREK